MAFYLVSMGTLYRQSLIRQGFGKEVEAVLAANTPKFTGAVPPDADELLEELIVFGTPAEARRRLARWHAAGAALPVLLLRPNLSRRRARVHAERPASGRGGVRSAHGAGPGDGTRSRGRRLQGRVRGRVPAYPIAGSFAGCLDGLSIEEYCTNPKKAVKAMLNYYERYQPDIMIAFNDLAKEAEAIGCHVKYSDYVVPSIDQHVLQDDKGQLARLEVPDPYGTAGCRPSSSSARRCRPRSSRAGSAPCSWGRGRSPC